MNTFREKPSNAAQRAFHVLTHDLFLPFIKVTDAAFRIPFAARLHVNPGGLAQQILMRIIVVHFIGKTGRSGRQIDIHVFLHRDVTLRARTEDE